MVTYTLNIVIKEMLVELGETNENKYARLLQHGISGLREFNFDLANGFEGVPTSVVLPVNSNQSVDLPADYINYVRIGVLDNNGNLLVLGLNNDMRRGGPVDLCGNPTNTLQVQTTSSTTNNSNPDLAVLNGVLLSWDGYADNFRNGELTGRFFGIGGGTNPNGYYRVDMKSGQILLGGVKASNVFLEYLSDLQAVDGEYLVHPYVVEALKCYIYWKMASRNERKTGMVKQESRQEYFNEFARAKARFNAHTVEEWYAAFRFSNKMSPRF